MKKPLVIAAVCLLLGTTGLRAGTDNKPTANGSPEKEITVYRVPWRCPAAPEIGCGSHAKPILLQLERDSSVSEAWLNRQGTAVAVVWKPDSKAKPRRQVEKTLKEQKASKLSGKARVKALAEFNSGKGWYRGVEVDRLSEEEAGIIAARLVRRVQTKTTLPPEKAQGLQGALTDALKERLTGKAEMPSSEEEKLQAVRRVAGRFLDEQQIGILAEVIGFGFRAVPGEN